MVCRPDIVNYNIYFFLNFFTSFRGRRWSADQIIIIRCADTDPTSISPKVRGKHRHWGGGGGGGMVSRTSSTTRSQMTGAKFVDMGIDPRTARAITEVMGYEFMTVVQVSLVSSSWLN